MSKQAIYVKTASTLTQDQKFLGPYQWKKSISLSTNIPCTIQIE